MGIFEVVNKSEIRRTYVKTPGLGSQYSTLEKIHAKKGVTVANLKTCDVLNSNFHTDISIGVPARIVSSAENP